MGNDTSLVGLEGGTMDSIRGTFQNGQIILSQPADWPEGTSVSVVPMTSTETFGIREEDWRTDPESIAAWLKWYDSLEPLEFTPEERTDIAAWRQRVKEHSAAHMAESIEGL